MNLALLQAKKNLGNTKENPAVGCVIVKNDCIISAGCTNINGRPHAEQNAINFSKKDIKNSDLYVTLEPCSHYGITPPCVKTIIKNKVRKVFFSVKDPDPRSFNKSSIQFKKKKINVKNGILFSKVNFFYRSYRIFKKNKVPFVTAKIAVSKDFYTGIINNKWITNKFSRGRVHLMRSNHDCVLTSSKTVIKDNPRFTCRIEGLENKSPSRIILDKNLKTPLNSYLVQSAKNHRTIIFFNKPNKNKINYLKRLNVKLIKFTLSRDGNFDLKNILVKIKLLGFSRIFLESGINLMNNFLIKGLINDFHLFLSNKKLGKNGSNPLKKNMRVFLKKNKSKLEKVNLFNDELISYRIK